MTTPRLTHNMRTALRQLHGSPRSAKAMRQDARTLLALQRAGLVRHNDRREKLWSLTAAGVDLVAAGDL